LSPGRYASAKLIEVFWVEESGPVINRQDFNDIFFESVNNPVVSKDNFSDARITEFGDSSAIAGEGGQAINGSDAIQGEKLSI
jgi:hypothetical protein